MKFIADLHVHSRYSRATARSLDIEHLYTAAQLKGITVVATGDFTHPDWFAEIREKLEPAEPGLFKLKNELATLCDESVPSACRRPVRFILEAEISNIYKKDGKTRKNHNLIYVPDMETAAAFAARLDLIGNIKSDGRPILGLDARHMLEILLEISDQAFLIPAHIWTPWFSVLGSKSGFDSIEACFEDLTPHIFAYETGLSSDPAMNWRVSALDHLTAVSNSDAHSPMNLGREANWFNTELCYEGIKTALRSGHPDHFPGTFEFYPEEGKYHLDGHRKCDICFQPSDSIQADGICPVCGKSLTLGVLHRVNELADHCEGRKPANAPPFYSIIPLVEILSEMLRVGPKSKKVQRHYHMLLETLGPEFDILQLLPLEKIRCGALPLLAEAVKRMRQKTINIMPGYDGEYGKITVFQPGELASLEKQKKLFDVKPAASLSKPYKARCCSDKKKDETASKICSKSPESPQKQVNAVCSKVDIEVTEEITDRPALDREPLLKTLNSEQLKAVCHTGGPLMIVAGPGTGKTRTLTHRIAFLIEKANIAPDHLLALTFTQKAAREMRDRLALMLNGSSTSLPFAGTFHALCLRLLTEPHRNAADTGAEQNNGRVINDAEQSFFISGALQQVRHSGMTVDANAHQLKGWIGLAKQNLLHPDDDPTLLPAEISGSKSIAPHSFSAVYQAYQTLLANHHLYDYEDLIFQTVRLLEDYPDIREAYRKRYPYIFVDEYQDINHGQYRIIRALAPDTAHLCVIGDPDQAIYGFRGSDVACFKQFLTDYPNAETISLRRNYRSTETILEASRQVIHKNAVSEKYMPPSSVIGDCDRRRLYSGINGKETVTLIKAPTEKSEAVAIGQTIERLMGGLAFHSADSGKVDGQQDLTSYGFSDFAVLYRTRAQARILSAVFQKAGIPFQVASRANLFDMTGIVELFSLLKIIEHQATFIDVERLQNIYQHLSDNKMFKTLVEQCFNDSLDFFEAYEKISSAVSSENSSQSLFRLSNFIKSLENMKTEMTAMTVDEKLVYLSRTAEISPFFENQPERQQALNYLIQMAAESRTTVDFISDIALKTDIDGYHPEAQKVTFMTIHAAKGLEFPVVFIAGCEKGLLPLENAFVKISDADEERRLFYVAITRAEEMLYLVYAAKRRVYGNNIERLPSPFVKDIAPALIETRIIDIPQASGNKAAGKQLELF